MKNQIPVYRINSTLDSVADYFIKIADEIYRKRELHQGFEKALTTGMVLGESPLSIDISFNTNGAYSVSSVFYPDKKLAIITGVYTHPLEGKGFGRKLVQSSEEVSRTLGMKYSAIVCNLEPGFWKKMGYHFLPDEIQEKNKTVHDLLSRMSGISIPTPDRFTFKKL